MNTWPLNHCCSLGGKKDSLSGMKAVIKQDNPATKLEEAKGRRRPMRSMVNRIKKAAGISTRAEIRKST